MSQSGCLAVVKIIADDLMMGAIQSYYSLPTAIDYTVNAKVDLLLFSNNEAAYRNIATAKQWGKVKPSCVTKAILQLIQEGRINQHDINKIHTRIQNLHKKLTSLHTADKPAA